MRLRLCILIVREENSTRFNLIISAFSDEFDVRSAVVRGTVQRGPDFQLVLLRRPLARDCREPGGEGAAFESIIVDERRSNAHFPSSPVFLAPSAGTVPEFERNQRTIRNRHCQCICLSFQKAEIQSKLGLLMLLSTWLSHCPLAVAQFLSIPSNIPFLTAQVRIYKSLLRFCRFYLIVPFFFHAGRVDRARR